jgi:hypothetical protein
MTRLIKNGPYKQKPHLTGGAFLPHNTQSDPGTSTLTTPCTNRCATSALAAQVQVFPDFDPPLPQPSTAWSTSPSPPTPISFAVPPALSSRSTAHTIHPSAPASDPDCEPYTRSPPHCASQLLPANPTLHPCPLQSPVLPSADSLPRTSSLLLALCLSLAHYFRRIPFLLSLESTCHTPHSTAAATALYSDVRSRLYSLSPAIRNTSIPFSGKSACSCLSLVSLCPWAKGPGGVPVRLIFGGGSRFTSRSCFSASASHNSHTGFRVKPSNGFLPLFFPFGPFHCFARSLFLCRPQPTPIRICTNQICHTYTTPRLICIMLWAVIRSPSLFRMALHHLLSCVNYPHSNGSVPNGHRRADYLTIPSLCAKI